MEISRQRIARLLIIYSEGKTSEEEEQELFAWIADHDDDGLVAKHIDKLLASYKSSGNIPEVDWEKIYSHIASVKDAGNVVPAKTARAPYRWLAAAAILLLLGTGLYFFKADFASPASKLTVVATETNDIAAPQTSNAVLTLNNGQKIILDNSGNGILAKQGSIDVVKMADGSIAYSGDGKEVAFNTLYNPRGSQVINLALSDGTRVWLNAESSLRYPTAFVGKERRVEVTGEAYFEVSPDAARPFRVEKGQVTVQVLGTHFNVNAYEEENALKITLLEGSVRVGSGSAQPVVIQPGEQAQVNKSGNIDLSASVDIPEVMAWKNGEFSFKGADIQSILREVGRWYNVEIVYDDAVSERFYAEVSRNVGISTLLKMLEATKAIHFKIEGKKIRVYSGESKVS